MTRRGVLAVLLAPLASVALGGCGYSLRTSLPPGIQSIHVPVLENRTQEPGIEDFITQALTQAVVAERSSADRPQRAGRGCRPRGGRR